jgi:hypothetical protein
MSAEYPHLDVLQEAYKAAAEAWMKAIQVEVELASKAHSLSEIDRWEAAAEEEERLRKIAKRAKKEYEDEIRQEFFGF